MIARRRNAKATTPSASVQTPASSGPRWTICSAIRAADWAAPSARRRAKKPANPHMLRTATGAAMMIAAGQRSDAHVSELAINLLDLRGEQRKRERLYALISVSDKLLLAFAVRE